MFLVVIRRRGNKKPESIGGLKPERFAFGDHYDCDIYCDGSRFQVNTNSNERVLIDTATLDNDSCRLKLSGAEGIVSRPLLFGLPIYYVVSDSELLLSTHVRLLQQAGIRLEDNPNVLPEYFVYRYITPPKTLFLNVSCIPIGGALRFHLTGNNIKAEDASWTTVFNKASHPLSIVESVAIITDDMRKGMKSLEASRDQVGCLLSGGVDSSMLYKLAKDVLSLNESHSTGFPFEDPAYNDERKYAEAAAETLGSNHHYHEFTTEQFLHALIDAVDHAAMPIVNLQSALLELVFGRALDPRTRIVLNGEGADGVFGTTTMWSYQKYRWLVHSPFAPFMGILGRTLANQSFPYQMLYMWSRKDWSLDLDNPNHAIWLLGEVGEKTWVKEYFRISDAEIIGNRMHAISHFDPSHILDAFSMLGFVTDADINQVIWGLLAAAHGRRGLYPFSSPVVINAAFNTSWEEKLPNWPPKRLGRAVAEQLGVPQSILARPKRSFGISASRWAGPGGVIEPVLKLVAPIVDIELLRKFQGPDEKTSMILWCWINYGIWRRLVINGESSETLHAELDEILQGAYS